MTSNELSESTKINLPETLTLLAPAIVLRTERQEHYDQIVAHYQACFVPKDILECTLLQRPAEATWLIMRYTRHQTVAIERWYDQSLAFQVQRIKSQNARREALASELADKMVQKPADIAHLVEREDKVFDADQELADILERTPTELEHNRALEKSVVFQDQLDKLITSATKRFNDALELFEHYREGLGRRLRQTADQILVGEFEEVERPLEQIAAPPLATSGESTPASSFGNGCASSRNRGKS